MARRLINVTDLLGEHHEYHNEWLDKQADNQPSPLDLLIEAETAQQEGRDDIPRVLLMGCRAWPVERFPVCGTCKSKPLPVGYYCLCCDSPKGTMVARTRAAVKRRAAKQASDGLKGGTGAKSA